MLDKTHFAPVQTNPLHCGHTTLNVVDDLPNVLNKMYLAVAAAIVENIAATICVHEVTDEISARSI